MEVAGDPPDAALRPAPLPRPISDGRISSVDVGPGAAVLPDAELVELPGATLLLSGDRSPVVPPLLCGLAGHAQPPGDVGPGEPAQQRLDRPHRGDGPAVRSKLAERRECVTARAGVDRPAPSRMTRTAGAGAV